MCSGSGAVAGLVKAGVASGGVTLTTPVLGPIARVASSASGILYTCGDFVSFASSGRDTSWQGS